MSNNNQIVKALQSLIIQKCVAGSDTLLICNYSDQLFAQYKLQCCFPFCISINEELDFVSPSFPSQTRVLCESDIVRIRFGVLINQLPSEVCTSFVVPAQNQQHRDYIIDSVQNPIARCFYCLKQILDEVPALLKHGGQYSQATELMQRKFEHFQVSSLINEFDTSKSLLKLNQILKFDLILSPFKIKPAYDLQQKFIFQLKESAKPSEIEVKFVTKIRKQFKNKPFCLRQVGEQTGFRPNSGCYDQFLVTLMKAKEFVHFVFEVRVGPEGGEILGQPIIANSVKM
ncbi:proliferation-associated_protein [Hexamita inflata]|uniref:Proliferation-associated protein n=1 Tax=Hexamita inflata TaxID=28002 RepID=A0AA86NSZ8_9EUKA|nr:proliferation-associated protein [Hexamita inflata]